MLIFLSGIDWPDAKRQTTGRGVAEGPAADVQLPVPGGRISEALEEAGLLSPAHHGAQYLQ